MKFSYRNWKKVEANKDHTLFQNNKGDELKVAHSRLSPKIRAELAALPVHMKDGGMAKKEDDKDKKEVQDIELKDAPMESTPESSAPMSATATEMAAAPSVAQPLPEIPLSQSIGHHIGSSISNAIGDAAGALSTVGSAIASPFVNVAQGAMQGAAGVDPQQAAIAAQQAALAPPQAAPAAQAPGIAPDALGTAQAAPMAAPVEQSLANDEMGLYQKGISEQEQGLKKEAAAVAQQAKAEMKAAEESQAAVLQLKTDFETRNAELTKERDAVIHDIQSGQIDPDHIWSTKSTPNKIATVIGLIAGGIGAGATGGINMAAKALSQEIDRDIDAQKANLGKKNNVLSALNTQMGDLRSSTDMLRSIQQGYAAEKLKAVAAQTKDPMAQAQLLKLSGELHAASAPVMAKMAAHQTVNKLMGEVNKDPSKAPALFDAMAKLDPKQAQDMRDRYIPGMGFAPNAKDRDALVEIKASADNTKSSIKELLQMAKKGSSISPADRARAETVAQLLKGSLNKMVTGGGPMSAQEQALIENIARNPLKIMSLSSANEAALKELQKRSDAWVQSQAKARGLNVQSPESQLNRQQQQYVQWARANPKDKRSALILAKLGLE